MSDDKKVSVEDIPKFIERLIDNEGVDEYVSLCFKKENERLNNIINELEKYTKENIKVLENRLNSPFCNFEKVTKELSIFQNYLDKLKELKEKENE